MDFFLNFSFFNINGILFKRNKNSWTVFNHIFKVRHCQRFLLFCSYMLYYTKNDFKSYSLEN